MIKNDSDLIVLEFDLPEFEMKDIKVKVWENKIDICAFSEREEKINEEDFDWFEKSSRRFDYSSSLPPVKEEKAEIEFINGRLKIKIPKK